MSTFAGFHPAARLEMRDAADFYDLERAGLGAEFLDEVERAVLQVLEYPKASPVVLDATRTHAISRFPYSVMYSVRDGGVFVSAVAHHSRRPFYWRDRA
ncbi:MAG TPA: type II toxin-antitoxin system RelE/ParE family toxin [Coriobacteriia bacterium]